MESERYRVDESDRDLGFINDLQLVSPEEATSEGWLRLGREPVQLLIDGRRQLLWVVYRHGQTAPLTSLAVFSQRTKPDRKAWSRAYHLDFRSASKEPSAETESLWLRRGITHPPLRRLAIISGTWSDREPYDQLEIRADWKLVQFNFSDTLADYVFLAFSAREVL